MVTEWVTAPVHLKTGNPAHVIDEKIAKKCAPAFVFEWNLNQYPRVVKVLGATAP